MIVAMKKVTLLILDEDNENVLTSLRDLGVMQGFGHVADIVESYLGNK